MSLLPVSDPMSGGVPADPVSVIAGRMRGGMPRMNTYFNSPYMAAVADNLSKAIYGDPRDELTRQQIEQSQWARARQDKLDTASAAKAQRKQEADDTLAASLGAILAEPDETKRAALWSQAAVAHVKGGGKVTDAYTMMGNLDPAFRQKKALADAKDAALAARQQAGFGQQNLDREDKQVYGTGERVAGQEFKTGERVAGQEYKDTAREDTQQHGTDERVAGQEFKTGERVAGQEFKTGERVAGQEFTTTQHGLDASMRLSQALQLADKNNAARMQAVQAKIAGKSGTSGKPPKVNQDALDDIDDLTESYYEDLKDSGVIDEVKFDAAGLSPAQIKTWISQEYQRDGNMGRATQDVLGRIAAGEKPPSTSLGAALPAAPAGGAAKQTAPALEYPPDVKTQADRDEYDRLAGRKR